MSASDREKQKAYNEKEYKQALLCKPNLKKRTVIALQAYIKFHKGKEPSTNEELLGYPITLEEIDSYITYLLKETDFYTKTTIMEGHYYHLIALYRHRN